MSCMLCGCVAITLNNLCPECVLTGSPNRTINVGVDGDVLLISDVIDTDAAAWAAIVASQDAFDTDGVLRFAFMRSDFGDLVARAIDTGDTYVWNDNAWITWNSFVDSI